MAFGEYVSAYTRYHSKCGISVGVKMPLGKINNLNIVIQWFDYLPPLKVILNPLQRWTDELA